MDNQQNITQPNLYQFASLLIEKAGFDKLSDNFRQDLKEQIVGEALNRLGMMITSELSEDKLKEYARTIEASPNPAADPKITQFLAVSIPNFGQKSATVLREYSEEFVAESQKALAK